MVYPSDGALLMIAPSAIMANARHPEAAKLFGQRASGSVRDPGVDCLPLGIPISSLVSEVHKVVQTPGQP